MQFTLKRAPVRRMAAGYLVTTMLALGAPAMAQQAATPTTAKANEKVLNTLNFADRAEFEDAQRGFKRKPDTLTIMKGDKVVWDLEIYKKFITLEAPAPASVNPSLWRNAQLNLQYGLFEVKPGIYQVRGYDLSNITFVRGKKGWLVFDVGSTAETAKAAYDLISEEFNARLPITAVVYSHSHVDHYSGVKGLVSQQDVDDKKVRIIAPDGFMEHAISEGVIAGNAMSRRATYMYGALLKRNERGSVGAGLGLTTPVGTGTLIEPTDLIRRTGRRMVVDGVVMEFQMTPGSEAPAEMNTYFPQLRAMWMAENTTNTMHNILTLRGAQVRDALGWSKYIDETIALYGDKIDVKFQSHHWPKWGEDVVPYLKKQRDLYKFIHDRSVNLLNKGYTGEEIAEMIRLPKSLEDFWPGRGYYGSLKHNSHAVYQRYMGWYDGNPAHLDPLPPEAAAKRYVAYMGGEAEALKNARKDFEKGDYRWVATVASHVVFANPDSKDGKELLAEALEQLGYQAESGPWRSIYLQGAAELRGPPPKIGSGSASPDTVRAMPPSMLFDYLAVRLNADKAEGVTLSLNVVFTDLKQTYLLTVENSVLNYALIKTPDSGAMATATLTKSALDDVSLGIATLESSDIKIEGDKAAFAKLMAMIDTFDTSFNIVTP